MINSSSVRATGVNAVALGFKSFKVNFFDNEVTRLSLGNTAKKGLKVGLSLGVFGQLLSWISTLFVVRILYPEDFAFFGN